MASNMAFSMLWSSREEVKYEGKREEKMDTARKMLRDHLPPETIMKYTGLSKGDIEQLEERECHQ